MWTDTLQVIIMYGAMIAVGIQQTLLVHVIHILMFVFLSLTILGYYRSSLRDMLT